MGAASIKRDVEKGRERKERAREKERERQRSRALSQVLAELMRMLISLMQTFLIHENMPALFIPFFFSLFEPERLTLMCSSRLCPCRCSDSEASFFFFLLPKSL